LKRYAEALQNYDKAIDINPNVSPIWHNKGITLENLKRYEQAIVAYDRAIQINQYSTEFLDVTAADSWYGRGVSLFAMKRYQEAVASFDRAIALRPDFADAIKARSIAQKWLR
jgi:tetratricopeptide (TPR) repeat protein